MSSEFFVHRFSFLSTEFFVHRLTQIIYFGTEIRGFFKDTAWLRIVVYPRHFVITACLRKFTATLYISSF